MKSGASKSLSFLLAAMRSKAPLVMLLACLCSSVGALEAETARAKARFFPADAIQSTPPLQLAAIDFLLPGYGMYRQNETGYAAAYFATNLVNLGLMYVAYRNWQFYESAFRAAELRQSTEPDPLQFSDPSGGTDYLTLQDIKNRAERGQLFFAVSVVANVALRFLSAGHTWSMADETKRRSGPRYEFYPDATGGLRAMGMYSFYF